ncbi:heparin binding hemagglutinin HbhA [Herbihabitans rhizosphaerae]|uniref:Heparin binding hemagglutinin HbhA n=1 Tax=Herbihabitans rhizosphaerae TaxID=1872711 RepID=A0A4Q7L5S4_9PSEU|nr:hypothetical protein [Herbihabitans rhizosphaerae]RZS44634.1 heparin binding hemagglutinin HbhA [Herbihabitans rhizosphaerae]
MVKTEEAREQASKAANTAIEQIRQPLLAALGAGDLAAKAVADFVSKAREQAEERSGSVKGAVDDLPKDFKELRGKLDPAELRKLVDEYTDAALKLYRKLTDQGEEALEDLRTQPQVKKAIDQLEDAIKNVQSRVEGATGDARGLADDLLSKVTRKTRSVGEKTANAVEEAGDELASEVRSTSRKVANKTAPARKPAAKTTTANARKTTTTTKK